MAKATLESIRAQSDKLHNRWLREFAGKPRHTRNLAELEKLLEKASALAKKAKGIPGEKGDALEKVVVERFKLYRAERDAIAEVQYDRPEVGEIHALGQRIERALAVWRRHYAGRDRRTRDLVRLDLVIAELASALPRMRALSEHPEVKKDQLESLEGQLELLKDERSEIDKVRRALEPSQHPVFLLAEAQSALDQYRVHFAKQPRTTCSLVRLDRLIGMLEAIVPRLEALGEEQANNVALLREQLEGWRIERGQIVAAQEQTAARDRTNHLGAVANQLFQLYQREFAGKPRATRNLQLLSDLCDRLAEIGDLMAEHDRKTGEAINRKNLPVVDERVRRYEAEWFEIGKVKAEAAQQQPQPAPAAVQAAPHASSTTLGAPQPLPKIGLGAPQPLPKIGAGPVPLPGISIAPKKED